MSRITTTGAVQLERLFDNYDHSELSITAKNGSGEYFATDDLAVATGATIRSSEESIATSALSGSVYTVADGTKFRVGEIVPVLSSADAYKGSVKIVSIATNDLSISHISAFTKASGDKLVLRKDSVIEEDSKQDFKEKYLVFKSSSSAVYLDVKKKI